MKVAIMQPYFFPYIGYFQLVAAVDSFVFYDDVNFIKGGWINRNRLCLSGNIRYFSVPLSGASPNLKINEIKTQPLSTWHKKMVESVRQSYSKAPNFKVAFDLFMDVLQGADDGLSNLAKASVIKTSKALGLTAMFIETSTVYENSHLGGCARVLDICLKEKAGHYVNLPGGRHLYNPDTFSGKGVQLDFIDPVLRPYGQFDRSFVPGLSILDVIMFNRFDEAKELLV